MRKALISIFMQMAFGVESARKGKARNSPVIEKYVAETGVTPNVRPAEDYLHVYNPVSRVYTLAPKEYFGNYVAPAMPMGGPLKIDTSGNVQRARLNRRH